MNRVELEHFMESYGGDILSFCKYVTKNNEEAEELCQDTFVKGYELMGEIEDEAHAKRYFLSVAVQLWKNRKRKYAWRNRILQEQVIPKSRQELETTGSVVNPEEEAIRKEQRELVRSCVNRLSEKKRLVILLYYAEGLKEKEIAAVLKLPVGTVKSRLHQGKADLEGMLSKEL